MRKEAKKEQNEMKQNYRDPTPTPVPSVCGQAGGRQGRPQEQEPGTAAWGTSGRRCHGDSLECELANTGQAL